MVFILNKIMYTIKYFENESQKIKTKEFETWEEAQVWGKKNLENFNSDLIQTIY